MMKKLTLISTIVAALLSSCTQEYIEGVTDSNLVGIWQLIEVLADPGDGSGTFQPIDSDAEIEFKADGTFSANTALCNFSSQSGTQMNGTYDLDDKVLKSDDCAWTDWQANYSIDDRTLILSFICIEPCAQKYERVGRR